MKTQENKSTRIYISSVCYGIFSFAMAVPQGQMNVFDWVRSLALNGILYVFLSLIIFDRGKPQPIADLILLFYILLLFAKQITLLNDYMKIYHRQTSAVGNIIATAIMIFMLSSMGYSKSANLIAPCALLTCALIAMVLILNFRNINPANLVIGERLNSVTIFDVTLFDYIIPLNIVLYDSEQSAKKKSAFAIILQILFLIIITVAAFSCIKGNLLYSISPLQIFFQVSSGSLIKNFDAIFNLLLYFAYFSSIILISCAYIKIKHRFRYFSNADLLLIFIFIMFVGDITDFLWFAFQLGAALVILFFSRKEKCK